MPLSAVEYALYFCSSGDVVCIKQEVLGDDGVVVPVGLYTLEELQKVYPGNVFLLDHVLKSTVLASGDKLNLVIMQAGVADFLFGRMYATKYDESFKENDLQVASKDQADLDLFQFSFPSIKLSLLVDGGSSSSSSGVPVYCLEQTDLFEKWYEAQDEDARRKISATVNDFRYQKNTHNNRIKACKHNYKVTVFEIKSRSDEGRRVYFTVIDGVIVLLNGGNKNGDQVADIDCAAKFAFALKTQSAKEKKEAKLLAEKAAKDERRKKTK